MNRQKKKVSHSSEDDDQVSIFDSEEDEPKHKKNESKAAHRSHKKGAISKPVKPKPKKSTARSREKKLSREEDDIMKKLMGKKEEERSRQSTESEKREAEDIKLDEHEPNVKREHPISSHEQPEWKDDSNPYEEIQFLDEYSATKDNENEAYAPSNQQFTPNYSAPSSSNNRYAITYPQPIPIQRPVYHHPQQTYAQPQQIYVPAQQPYLGYSGQYGHPQQAYAVPIIDPSIELNFQDFEEINLEDDRLNAEVNVREIEQLREEVELQKRKTDSKQDSKQDSRQDKRFRQRRMSYILAQIEKLKKEYIELEDLTAESLEAPQQQQPEVSTLLNEWKYNPNILKKPEKPKIEEPEGKPDEGAPKSKTEGRITMLNSVLTENPFLTQVEMADVMRAMDPVMNARIERSVVLRLLKMCGFKKKKVRGVCRDRNSALSLGLRSQYALSYRQYAAEGFQVYYFDELIVNEYFDKESGWCKAEEEVEFRPERFIDRSVVVLTLLSSTGTCKWNARFGNFELQDYCKTLSSLLKHQEAEHEKRLLVVNPLPYRDPKHIVDIVSRRGWEMLVLPSDGLGLNPLQAYFAEVRDIMKRKRYDTVETLFESVVEVLQDGDKQGLPGKALGRVDSFLDRAIRKELL